MALRKREYTKKEITELKRIEDDPIFNIELISLLEEFRQGDEVKSYLAERILEHPLAWATSVTWLVYEVCNAFNDHELERDWLSELVVEIEDLIEGIEKLVEKYKK